MKTILAALILAVAGAACAQTTGSQLSKQQLSALLSCSGVPMRTLDQLTLDAVSEDKPTAENAIRALRARGPEGLRALLETHADAVKQHTSRILFPAAKSDDPSWLRLKAAIDGVSQQHDCYASKLYWYTDFEQAKAAAKATAKPILSLRLLGKLDEEFSCANSRFFRTTLYANAEVSKYLSDHFILHWKSVRPVPRVTIDFGDGRKLERTITGNSIHYVLDSDGRVIDALPGLYGAQAFMRGLGRAEEIVRERSTLAGEARDQSLRAYHRSRSAELQTELAADLQRVSNGGTIRMETVSVTPVANVIAPPGAQAAGRRAIGKGRAETPILRATLPASSENLDPSKSPLDDATWQKIAALHADDARLDESSKTLMRAKNPTASDASRRAGTKAFVEDPLIRQIRNLERSISEDTARNEYLFHAKIHEWLVADDRSDVDTLNRKVYAELFLTPDSDPWLGLVPRDTFTALENDGLVQLRKAAQ